MCSKPTRYADETRKIEDAILLLSIRTKLNSAVARLAVVNAAREILVDVYNKPTQGWGYIQK